MKNNLLNINNLSVEYKTQDEIVKAVNNVSIKLNRGETLGLVGETGAGKTTTALSVMRLLPVAAAKITGGEIFLGDTDLLKIREKEMRKIRGQRVSMIYQDPMTSLNPVMTVGDQIAEVLHYHDMLSHENEKQEVGKLLEMVGIPAKRHKDYPHQFSGGMKQRVIIAMALACNPELLIADEPTTALDVTIQAQVLDIMNDIKINLNTSMILITHDLGIVAEMCDNVCIMYAGEIIESGTVEDIFSGEKHHPYTIGLFNSIPKLNEDVKRLTPVPGLIPNPAELPDGCKFHPRCPSCMEICKTDMPHDIIVNDNHYIRCHLYK